MQSMKIPQIEPYIGEEEYKELKSCFDTKWVTEGPKTKDFEAKLLDLIGAKYGVFAPNGTLALYLALVALGIGGGDEVIVPDFTFIASATSVVMTGAKPVFVDVNPRNFQIDITLAHKLINKHTKAIMPVHMYGTMCNMEPIVKFAKKYDLKLIEDAAQAIGVKHDGRHAGTFGDAGCFSFFADKTITTGEGGFVVTDSQEVYDNLLYLRNQGRRDRGIFIHPKIGYNFRITDFHSALGLAQLRKLPKIIQRKREILDEYKTHLSRISEISIFAPDTDYDWIPFRVGLLAENAFDLMQFMERRGISTRSFFYPLHKQPAFLKLGQHRDEDFPNSIYGYEHGVCLPTYPTLKTKEIVYICDAISDFYLERRSLFYKYYDRIYENKDYRSETNYIFNVASSVGLGYEKILEIGSGTGNHTRQILKNIKVKKIVAVDVDRNMVNKIKEKLSDDKRLEIVHGDVSLVKSSQFDLAIAMFNVVTYISDFSEIEKFFMSVFSLLKLGGVLIFDAWNGIAAIKDPPKNKRETMTLRGDRELELELNPHLDLLNQHVILKYSLTQKRGGVSELTGTFNIDQYLWTPLQLRSIYKKVGFEEIGIYSLNDMEKTASDDDWKVLYVLRKPSKS